MVRLGVIGHGGRVSGLIKDCFRAVQPEVRVVGIVDPNEEAARARLADCDRAEARFYGSVAEMVRGAKPDGLVIGTRCNLHAPFAVEAAAYDLPLFLEKPVATSMEQALSLERAFEKSRCPVVVSFPLRVSPLCLMVRRCIDEKRIGSPEHILGINYVPYGTVYFDNFYRNYGVTQGLFLQKATHDLDYMMFLMGSPIRRIAAMHSRGRVFGGTKPAGLVCSACGESATCPESPGNRRRNCSGGDLSDHPCLFGSDIGTPESGMNEDSSSALLELASGAHGAYTQVFYTRRDAAARGATVSGYNGTVSFDWYKNEMSYVRHHEPFSDVIRAGEGMSHFGGDMELAYDFMGLVSGTAKSRTPIQAGLQSVYACLAAKESAETGRFIDVRQVAGWR
jgi:predicted dehydrogenase